MGEQRLKKEDVRAYNSDLGVACIAPEAVFFPEYNDIPAELRVMIEQAGGIPCEGGGVPGNWCQYGNKHGSCPWYRSGDQLLEQHRIDLDTLPTEKDYAEEIR